ncbi:molybdate-binding periplasmic protein [Methanothermobacter sp. MT-2]|nr:molybdate-binding periplasmic protein [Methanothermobacter sp. MT-2]HHW05093.1 molybdate ABC transporter substrate-binding protein [Methanothermobacter sp.]HPU37901.1 molybdate ABC transporter substrate-binding protein [Methanothermobacter sp.]
MNRKILSSIVCLIIIVSVVGVYIYSNTPKNLKGHEITVLCGAGLMKPMNEIVKNFEKETGAKVNVQYGGTGELLGTLMTSKKGDVLVSGEYTSLEKAAEKGYILNDTVINITSHKPVIAVRKGNPKNITSLRDLARNDIKVAIGDPKACAIGKVAQEMFKEQNLDVDKNIVAKTPTVNQLLTYILTGQVDAVIIWEDMLTWNNSKAKLEAIEIPGAKNQTIPAAVTTVSEDPKTAEKFIEYLKSDESRKIWEKWGFKLL